MQARSQIAASGQGTPAGRPALQPGAAAPMFGRSNKFSYRFTGGGDRDGRWEHTPFSAAASPAASPAAGAAAAKRSYSADGLVGPRPFFFKGYSSSINRHTSPASHTKQPHPASQPRPLLRAQEVVRSDENLAGHEAHLRYRYDQFLRTKAAIEANEGSLEAFASGYQTLGFRREGGRTVYREWAPGAAAAQLIGDFNGWGGTAMERDEFGVWSVTLPDGARVGLLLLRMCCVCITRSGAWGRG